MNIWLKNGNTVKEHQLLQPTEVLIQDGRIAQIGSDLREWAPKNAEIIDVKGGLITPGLVDVHVHLREPGFSHKETIKTGSKAAARGGFTTICAMPNTNPVPDTAAKMTELQEKIKEDAVVHVLQYAPITEGLKSEVLVDQHALLKAGAFAFTNDGVGVQTAGTMYLAMEEAAKNHTTIVAHTEDDSLLFGGVIHKGDVSERLSLPGILSITEASQIARDVLLAEATGAHYHVCHVSTKESVRVIRDAKAAGIHVTAEVTPHHLLLTENDILEDDANFKMNPPLRGQDDLEALIEGLLDGTIDCIATDHAPHSEDEKKQSMLSAPFGIVGSEYAFQLLYTHLVKEKGIFTLEQLVHWMTVKPAEIFSLKCGTLKVGAPADIACFDLETATQIDKTTFESLGKNTPFNGWNIYGDTMYTFVDGKMVFEKGVQA